MYIQFQTAKNSKEKESGSITTDITDSAQQFLLSFANKVPFKVYASKETQKKFVDTFKTENDKILRELIIESVKPLNEGESPYLVFTAKSATKKDMLYEGMINFE